MRNWFKRKKKSTDKMDSIAKRWKLLSGKNNWEGLLDPLDHDLRRYIIHYGEMAQASYDNFNSDRASKNAGNFRYSKNHLFAKVGLEKGNPFKYRVTKYLYATSSIQVPEAFIVKSLSRESWSKESNWIGFIAVVTDEGKAMLGRREILISWRGTVQTLDWVDDLDFFQVPAPKIFRGNTDPEVHRGWYSIYTSDDPQSPLNKTSARDQVLEEVTRLVEEYKREEISITITGHSMGAAVGTLNAMDIVANGFNKPRDKGMTSGCLVTAFLFASPRVGDSNFRNAFSKLENLRILRVSNAFDIIPNYPMVDYSEIGVELAIDTTKSNYLKVPGDVRSWHSLEAHMHGVLGLQGAKCGFKLEVQRDISLVNKHLDALKDEYCVPSSWWIEKNNGMVQQDDGSWNLIDHEDDDDSTYT
ncbi:LOW QUALITY PROTEIN: phospholipase A1-IIgamma-like [Lycium ferocissimum]|uniref:LOW QUALITY PROTEIN: phospholipase A1-IIgamma-like n=1 Tax=Lycium ferocissimum TaxID=112874 RepID=UPI002814FE05|nr:LOW QUALITY PROTEIN: phospholipase A1-IIgamma-like [Lycium ferocissimum]